MGNHAQTIVVIAAVAACALILARRLVATFGRGKAGSCGCDTCPAKKTPH